MTPNADAFFHTKKEQRFTSSVRTPFNTCDEIHSLCITAGLGKDGKSRAEEYTSFLAADDRRDPCPNARKFVTKTLPTLEEIQMGEENGNEGENFTEELWASVDKCACEASRYLPP